MSTRSIGLLSFIAIATAPACLASNVWTIDSAHSSADFSVRHMMISNVKGDFRKVEGTIDYDGKNAKSLKIEATIDASTVNTGEKGRDEHLKGGDFFDVEKYPKMTFKSKSAKKVGKDKIEVVGELTMKGVTKDVTLTVDGPTAEIKDPHGGFKIGAAATTKINRKDFGITYGKLMDNGGAMIGDDVAISLEIEAGKKQ